MPVYCAFSAQSRTQKNSTNSQAGEIKAKKRIMVAGCSIKHNSKPRKGNAQESREGKPAPSTGNDTLTTRPKPSHMKS